VSVTVPINDDSIPEGTESFVAVLKTSDATPNHVSIGKPSSAIGLITDDDPVGKHTHVHCTQMLSVSLMVDNTNHKLELNLMIRFNIISVTIAIFTLSANVQLMIMKLMPH